MLKWASAILQVRRGGAGSGRWAEDAWISLFVSVSRKGEEWKESGPTRNELSVFSGFAAVGWLRGTALRDARSQPFSLTPSTMNG